MSIATPGKKERVTINKLAVRALMAEDLNDTQIAKQLNLSIAYVWALRRRWQKTVSDDIAGLKPTALKSLKNLIEGVPFGSIQAVKCSTALSATKEVLDRTDAKISLSASVDQSYVHYDFGQAASAPIITIANDTKELACQLPDVAETIEETPEL
jgi:hypothetical protein